MAKTASVVGELFAKSGVSFMSESELAAEEKLERFKTDTDVVDEVETLLE